MLVVAADADKPARHRGYAACALLLINAAIYAHASYHGLVRDFVDRFGFVPAEPTAVSAVTALFIHGYDLHLPINLAFLGLFAASLEASLGPVLMPACFLACGLAGEFAHCLVDPGSAGIVMGTSGAITGLLGLHLALHGRTDFVACSWIWRGRRRQLAVSITFAVAMWLIAQGELLVHVLTFESSWAGSVGFISHGAGFVTGVALGRMLRWSRDRRAAVHSPGRH